MIWFFPLAKRFIKNSSFYNEAEPKEWQISCIYSNNARMSVGIVLCHITHEWEFIFYLGRLNNPIPHCFNSYAKKDIPLLILETVHSPQFWFLADLYLGNSHRKQSTFMWYRYVQIRSNPDKHSTDRKCVSRAFDSLISDLETYPIKILQKKGKVLSIKIYTVASFIIMINWKWSKCTYIEKYLNYVYQYCTEFFFINLNIMWNEEKMIIRKR